jgi:hypothetical protein
MEHTARMDNSHQSGDAAANMSEPPIRILRIDAAKSQLATAIKLYFENFDPVSVHTLAKAAGEIIDRLCVLNGTPGMRSNMMDMIVPQKRDYVGDALNKAANFFKHASSKKPDTTPFEFSDEQNFFAILMAVDGLRLLGMDLLEAKVFGAWVSVVEPSLLLNPPDPQAVAKIFGDVASQPRAQQKQDGRDALSYIKTGKLPPP